jgi:uncharacterized protein YhdP
VIAGGSLMSRVKGVFSIRAATLAMGGMTARDMHLAGNMADRIVTMTRGHMRMAKGELTAEGSARLVSVPRLSLTGRVNAAPAPDILALFGRRSALLDGPGSMAADLTFTGADSVALARSASGRVSFFSGNGVIRKWNLLAKVLALTNVYDLFRGKVDLTRHGLVYRQLGASFLGRDGLFHTEDFIIDSPSMLITGAGDVNLATSEVDAKMTVSPLVTIDKFINMVPLVRSVVREKKSGLIFFVYNLRGPMQDPEVESTYVASVGSRLVFLLRNALQLPKGLWDRLSKELYQ